MPRTEPTGLGPDLSAEADRLLDFAVPARRDEGGFSWLDRSGRPDPRRPAELWITCRMTHSFALGVLRGRDDLAPLVDHGLASLAGPFRDREHGGWFAALGGADAPGGDQTAPVDDTKQAYAHAFVVLAAASAHAAGRPGAAPLLSEALRVLDDRFAEGNGLTVDTFDRAFTDAGPYRGVNATMHTVEALLAAGDVLGEAAPVARALRILSTVVSVWARSHAWRIPEHFSAAWEPDLLYNRERPADPFRPFGATVGHSFEWGRLGLQAVATAPRHGLDLPAGLQDDCLALVDAAHATWGVDGEPGYVYTTDWDGTPVVRSRMHWVPAEAVNALAVAHDLTGLDRYREASHQVWRYIDDVFVDRELGSWHHELDARNRPIAEVWPGKPDIYHALQACLLPSLPPAPAFAAALRDVSAHR
jgi:sulfoquinovose isomerase